MNTNKKTIIIALSTLIIGVLIGWLLFSHSSDQAKEEHNHATEIIEETTWTCSMHPQIRKNEPGDCPICGMNLIPLENGSDEIDPMAINMSSTARQLANVQTAIVESGNASKSIRLNGKIQADERLMFTQSSHIPGRIEKLTVNFTGDLVKKGQVIAYVYSPELVNAQEELFEAKKIKDSQPALFNAAKEKLKNWKLTNNQIDQVLAAEKAIEQFPILANVSGYVTKKMVNLGDYIKLGQPLYEIADLTKVWVLFDVYETEMSSIKKGDKVSYTVQSLPGKTFEGTISYVDPTINPKTRVAQARLEAANKSQNLKPEMFVSGIIQSNLGGESAAITVPKTAIMWTGKRSVAYVKNTTAQGVSFKMRQVTLGTTLGDSYLIESGLQPGEEIAVNGTFSIDAAAQLAGKPSMMNPEGGVAMTGHNHGAEMTMTTASAKSQQVTVSKKAKQALAPLLTAYFKMKQALSKDDFENAKKVGVVLNSVLEGINMSLFKGSSHNVWMGYSSALKSNVQHIAHMSSIDELRLKFINISQDIIGIAESFEPMSEPLYIQHCPMANSNKGADWLSQNSDIVNPYFGSAMLTCGEVTKEL
jgi:Cu(I)/Ag(I) efflux system membrane fusion protein